METTELDEPEPRFHVTSFSSIPYCGNSDYSNNSEQPNKNFNSCIFNLFLELRTRLVLVHQVEVKDVA